MRGKDQYSPTETTHYKLNQIPDTRTEQRNNNNYLLCTDSDCKHNMNSLRGVLQRPSLKRPLPSSRSSSFVTILCSCGSSNPTTFILWLVLSCRPGQFGYRRLQLIVDCRGLSLNSLKLDFCCFLISIPW